MAWFRIDDGFYDHPKIAELDSGPIALFVMMGSYACRHRTDGYVPEKIIQSLGRNCVTIVVTTGRDGRRLERCFKGASRPLEALVEAGLVERLSDGSCMIHDYLQWNPSKIELEELSQVRASAGRRGGFASGNIRRPNPSKQTKQTPSNREANAKPTHTNTGSSERTAWVGRGVWGEDAPLPRRSQPKINDQRGMKIDRGALPTDADRVYAVERGLDEMRAAEEWEKFRDHHLAKGSVFKDWSAAWRNWVRNSVGRFAPPPKREDRHGRVARILDLDENGLPRRQSPASSQAPSLNGTAVSGSAAFPRLSLPPGLEYPHDK